MTCPPSGTFTLLPSLRLRSSAGRWANSAGNYCFGRCEISKPEYINLETDTALREKWARGAEQYGQEFVGHPLVELDEELLDAINYVEEAKRQGWKMGNMPQVLRALRATVQAVYVSAPVASIEGNA